MTRHPSLLIASGLALALFAAAVLAQAPRGLDFRTYLSIQRGMAEGEVFAIAGPPDLQADQGVVFSGPSPIRGRGRAALAVKTYTYLPTTAVPHTTTITFVGGRVSEIRRDRKF